MFVVKPLRLNLSQCNEKYFPGQFGARHEINNKLKKIHIETKKRKFIDKDDKDNKYKDNKYKDNKY